MRSLSAPQIVNLGCSRRNRAQRRSINSATYYDNRRIGGYERLELRFALRSQDFAVARRDDHHRGVARRDINHRRDKTKQESLPQDLDAGQRQEPHRRPTGRLGRERATERHCREKDHRVPYLEEADRRDEAERLQADYGGALPINASRTFRIDARRRVDQEERLRSAGTARRLLRNQDEEDTDPRRAEADAGTGTAEEQGTA